jgi:hypothetical protein
VLATFGRTSIPADSSRSMNALALGRSASAWSMVCCTMAAGGTSSRSSTIAI